MGDPFASPPHPTAIHPTLGIKGGGAKTGPDRRIWSCDPFGAQTRSMLRSERYQRMLIGAQGQMIQRIGTAARIELEQTFARKVFLDLDVMVSQHGIE